MTQDEYSLLQAGFFAGHPGQGPTSSLMSVARAETPQEALRFNGEDWLLSPQDLRKVAGLIQSNGATFIRPEYLVRALIRFAEYQEGAIIPPAAPPTPGAPSGESPDIDAATLPAPRPASPEPAPAPSVEPAKTPWQPMQPVERDAQGIVRFRRNHIVNYVIDWCARKNKSAGYPPLAAHEQAAPDLNELSRMNFTTEDWEQLAQLIGYSVSGFGSLSYVRDETLAHAERLAATLPAPPERGTT